MEQLTSARKIKSVWQSIPTLEGAGVQLKRVFGFKEVPRLDPFLLLDSFHSENPDDYRAGFPWHPHRGMETITYVLDGDVEHRDSLGNQGVITPGSVQWMTAGRGIIHQEMPKGNARGALWGMQLWINLPRESKMKAPQYRDVTAGTVPVVKTAEGATVRVVAGRFDGAQGPVRGIATEPEYFDVSLAIGQSFAHSVNPAHTVFAFVVEGSGSFDAGHDPLARPVSGRALDQTEPTTAEEGEIVLYGPGDTVLIRADRKPVRFLFISGKPLNEPIAWGGPIVMNTQDELRSAFQEFQEGTFLDPVTA